MQRSVVMLMLLVSSARAQPSATSDLEACKARRRDLAASAMRLADLDERGRQLAAMPVCRRNADGTTEIIAEQPLAPSEPPFAPRFTFAVSAGVAASAVLDGAAGAASAFGPMLDLDASWRPRRHLAIGAFAGYSSLHDNSYEVPYVVGTVNGLPVGGVMVYDVRDRLYEAGAHVSFPYDVLAFGAGLGVEIESGRAYGAYSDYTNLFGQLRADAAYRVAMVNSVGVELTGVVTAAFDPRGQHRELLSTRLGLGLCW